MAETIEQNQHIAESVRFYIAPRGNGSINLKKTLTEALRQCFPSGRDLHATLDPTNHTLTIKEM